LRRDLRVGAAVIAPEVGADAPAVEIEFGTAPEELAGAVIKALVAR